MKKLGILLFVFIVGFLGVMAYILFMSPGWISEMPHYDYYYGYGHMMGGTTFFIGRLLLMCGLFFLLIAGLYLFFIRASNQTNHSSALELRLARGEISLEDYQEIKEEIRK